MKRIVEFYFTNGCVWLVIAFMVFSIASALNMKRLIKTAGIKTRHIRQATYYDYLGNLALCALYFVTRVVDFVIFSCT